MTDAAVGVTSFRELASMTVPSKVDGVGAAVDWRPISSLTMPVAPRRLPAGITAVGTRPSPWCGKPARFGDDLFALVAAGFGDLGLGRTSLRLTLSRELAMTLRYLGQY